MCNVTVTPGEPVRAVQRQTIVCSGQNTVAIRTDGTVVAVGNNHNGQCEVPDWENIAAVAAGYYQTVGLRSDGTVVAVGQDVKGTWDVVSGWTDIKLPDA